MINKPRGTEDILPKDTPLWRKAETVFHDVCSTFGYSEIRTPVFEDTSLFSRGVGDTSDVVQKEMYTFEDKGGRSITLRPEGTASLARSYIENSLYAMPQPTKLYYLINCYRYEKPQAGRLREFHQFGIECFGGKSTATDAEAITLALTFLNNLGIKDLKLKLNSIGCTKCKKEYNEKLLAYFTKYKETLCGTCLERLDKNPMRIIDCKSPVCQEIAKDAPHMADNLCEECSTEFEKLKAYLSGANIAFEVDKTIVRGLDYYTRTVFEITSDALGAQSTVCGGGRYNGLVEELGGKPTEGIGFAIGVERLLMIMKSQGLDLNIKTENPPEIFIVSLDEKSDMLVQNLVHDLRQSGIHAERDLCDRSVKAQMKFANKLGAKFSMVIGDDEITSNIGKLKNMDSGDTIETALTCADIMKNL
ncbi:MAG: histidine--tRNA ligase [Oscillospiraceae bacterium]